MKTKMIKKLFPCTMILGVFALLLGVSSCRDAAIPEEELAAGEPIRFDIGFAQGTRVTTTDVFTSTWQNGDAIGIFAVVSGSNLSSTPAENYINNVKLTYNSTGQGSWVLDDGEIFWPQNGDQLDFYAYYPYDVNRANPLAIPFSVKDNQNVQVEGVAVNNFSLSDLMTAVDTNVSRTNEVNLQFTHKMVLLHVIITDASNLIQDGTTVTVTLNNARIAIAPFNLSAAAALTASAETSNITMYRVGADTNSYVFRALVPAATSGTITFKIEYDDHDEVSTHVIGDGGVALTAGHYSLIEIDLTAQP